MPQREIHVTPGQFGWLILGVVFAGTAAVQVYLFFVTAAWWPASVAMVLGTLASGCALAARHRKNPSSTHAGADRVDNKEPTG